MIILISSGLINIYGQSFNWAKKGGSFEYDYGNGIANDSAGNVYPRLYLQNNKPTQGFTLMYKAAWFFYDECDL